MPAITTLLGLDGSASPSYLLPMPASPKLNGELAKALREIEAEFALDKDLLQKTVKQMMWEFQKGLTEHADESNRDTFLPMMYACESSSHATLVHPPSLPTLSMVVGSVSRWFRERGRGLRRQLSSSAGPDTAAAQRQHTD